MRTTLPIDTILPELVGTMADRGCAVLEAPPGAGKTTRAPLALLEAGLTGRLIMLEPRRIAARAAAERMADTLGEPVGQTVGYRIRGEARTSAGTRIEVVTEGILTRMLQSDPSLHGVGTVIFDEFHERSLNADLGLALCLEVRAALREDLNLLVMSATLDGAAVADLMDAPVIRSEGRAYPVETRWLDRPVPKAQRFEAAMANLILQAASQTEGSVLAFLPGEGEIRRVEGMLSGKLPDNCTLRPLYGALPFAAQRKAIAPEPQGRKLVLATSIAETSLTIEGVSVVVDGGLARRARFDPGSGMSRLVTKRVSRAEATQRQGRAGRLSEGICYRLWTKGEEGALPAYAPAEIDVTDLAGLALELAQWGARSPDDLAFLTPPNPGAFAEAQRLLMGLGAMDADGAITDHGHQLATLPLHPRLGHMLTTAGRDAAPLAALLAERDPMRGAGVDLLQRLKAIQNGDPRADRATLDRIRSEAKRLSKGTPPSNNLSPGQMASLAYPDRIGLRRPGDDPRWVLSGGKGARMDATDILAGARLIVVTDTDGNPREARIRQAVEITEAELREIHGNRIAWQDVCLWSRRKGRVLARRQERLGALVLDDRNWADAPPDAVARAMLDGVRELGLVWSDAAARFRARVELVRATKPALPAMDDLSLIDSLDEWLLPHLGTVRTAAAWRSFDILPALRAMLDWDQMQLLDRAAPAAFTSPLGRKIAVDYAGETPEIAVRLQEMFGITTHPQIAGQPLRISLLSPAGRAVQVTTDLPGFWTSSYADVRKDMRGRYPKHPWPEDPTVTDPTLRAKRRKS